MADDSVASDIPPQWAYAYRPSLLGAGCAYRLTPVGIAWDVGAKSGVVPYRDIRYIRMAYRPAAMQQHRFVTEVRAASGPRLTIASTSWKSLVEQERLDLNYTTFVTELHRRVARDGTGAVCETGGNAVKYWIGVVVFCGVALGLAGLTVRVMQLADWGGAAIVGFFLAVFLWQSGNYFRRNRPRRYDPAVPPAELLP